MILLAIGANLPAADGKLPQATCRAAVEALHSLSHLAVVRLSRWHTTPPDPPSSQAWYCNGVVRLSGTADPASLLRRLQAIEQRAGRVRSVANAARVLDIDIIAIGDLVRDSPDPVLPHPRAHLRRFVLAPLAEVAPGWTHPRLGRSVEEMLAALPA